VLLEVYPIDVAAVANEAGMTESEANRVLRGMEDRGWVFLERLPGRTFVRLLRRDFQFIGRAENQKRAIKHKGKGQGLKESKRKVLRDDHDDIMYA